MSIIVLSVLGLLLLLLGYSIMRPSDDSAQRSRAKPAGKVPVARTRLAQDGKMPAAFAEAARPRVDLTRFAAAPAGTEFYHAREGTLEGASELMSHAESIGRSLKARRTFLDALSDAEYDPRKVSELVLGDPALASQLLRTVNSPFYGLQQQVASVFRAIVLLGHVEVRNIIWRACVSDNNRNLPLEQNRFLDELWRHSFNASRLAFAIARESGQSEPDKVATTALLHDIGKLICLNVWPDRALSLYHPICFSDAAVLTREDELQIWHAAFGAGVAHSWGLPQETCTAILHHHAPSYLEPSEVNGDHRAIAALHLADLICHNAERPARFDAENDLYLPKPAWLQLLRLESMEQVYSPAVLKILPKRSTFDAESEEGEDAASARDAKAANPSAAESADGSYEPAHMI